MGGAKGGEGGARGRVRVGANLHTAGQLCTLSSHAPFSGAWLPPQGLWREGRGSPRGLGLMLLSRESPCPLGLLCLPSWEPKQRNEKIPLVAIASFILRLKHSTANT